MSRGMPQACLLEVQRAKSGAYMPDPMLIKEKLKIDLPHFPSCTS